MLQSDCGATGLEFHRLRVVFKTPVSYSKVHLFVLDLMLYQHKLSDQFISNLLLGLVLVRYCERALSDLGLIKFYL